VPSAGEEGLCFADVLFFKYIFIDFCQTSYLNIYRTDFHGICRIDRTLTADERPEVIFDPSRDGLPWQPTLWTNRPAFHTL